MGHFYAWKRQVIDGPCWTLVTNAVALADGSLPDFSRQDDHRWWEFCVRVNPFVYSALAAETLEKAGVELRFNTAACGMEKLPDGWDHMITFRWPKMPEIDEVKSQTALSLKLKNGVTSLTRELGPGECEKIVEERRREKELFESAGLVYQGEAEVDVGSLPEDPSEGDDDEEKPKKQGGENAE